ncbi:hypothetical protein T265_11532 [Opisthorchis viverrini]|uniref:Ubiquinone biosynthesis protein n=1 Tax=Opisthorchis viverrini TaxID=6198 RepID=A0A074YYB2_OPIVI|nr:hypothetical protein T265_11532 [Opisthorchis viverrini]KER19781.1 hypothetical protein T265_11532 [Opisthorchis viverrini]
MEKAIAAGNSRTLIQLIRSTGQNKAASFSDSSHTSENSGSSDSQAMHLQLTDSDLRSRILEAALDYVQEYGWSRNAVEAACVAGGFPPGMHTMVTPQGGVDLVLYFYASRNQQLADTMVDWRTSDSSSSSASVDDGLPRFSSPAEMDAFLYRALKFRLEKITPVLPVWPQALGLLALPSNMPSSIGLLAQLVDEIWAQCGDRTTDLKAVSNMLRSGLLTFGNVDREPGMRTVQTRIVNGRSVQVADFNIRSIIPEGCRNPYPTPQPHRAGPINDGAGHHLKIQRLLNLKQDTAMVQLGSHGGPEINNPGHRKYLTVAVNGHPVRLQLDTASDITIISEKLWRKPRQPPIGEAARTATSACDGELKLSGELQYSVYSCYVPAAELTLLDLDWFGRLGLVDIPISVICNTIQSPTAYPTRSTSVHCDTSSPPPPAGATPVFHPKKVPYASLSLVDAELQRLEQQGVMSPYIPLPLGSADRRGEGTKW